MVEARAKFSYPHIGRKLQQRRDTGMWPTTEELNYASRPDSANTPAYTGIRQANAAPVGEYNGVTPIPANAPSTTGGQSTLGLSGMGRPQRGTLQPDGSRLVDTQTAAPARNVPVHNYIMDSATGNTVSMRPDGSFGWTDIAGEAISKPVSAPAPANGIRRVGNMDVAFDSSVSPEARQRFMEQPVAPTGQMRQYENYMNTPRGQQFGVRPLNQDQSGLLTRENAPAGMGWQERKALNEQLLSNRQSGVNAELQADVTREGLRPTAQEQVETEAAQIGLRSAQRIETALRDYETADTPEKKAAALERYRLLTKTKEPSETKPEIRTESIVENGVMRDRTVAITVDKDGNITKREVPEAGQGAGAPTAAINERMLKNKNDPTMIEDYVKLFGKEAYEKNIGPLPK